jgi:2-methylcitrate dehydratase PrpD
MANLDSDIPAKSKRVAAFIAGFDLRNAPAELIDAAETAFIDTIGVMLAGSCEPAAKIVCDMIAAEGAGPAALIVGRHLRTSVQNAALANGTATQALDFDLSFMSGQSAAAVIPALLPLAETTAETTRASARDLIAAFIVGCEIAARVVRSFPTLSSEGGWHGAGIVGSIAAAAACAKLTQAPTGSLPTILGIAASTASGLGANFGTMTKPLHPGIAARNGMMAAHLGARGFTASDTAIEGPQGFLALYARGLEWDPAPFDDLGGTFNLLDPGYKIKPFSCGGLLHTAIEAALHLREAAQPRLDQIDKIVIGATPHAVRRVIDQYPWSEDSARFSLRYLIPHALIRGAPTLATFSEEALEDEAVRALSDRITARVDEEFSGGNGIGYSPSRVTITFTNGDRLEKTVIHPSGSKESPMSEATIKAKFDDCAARAVSESTASELYGYLRNFRDHENLTYLWPLLAGNDEA